MKKIISKVLSLALIASMAFAFAACSGSSDKKDEDSTLEDEESRLSSFEKIYQETDEIGKILSGSESAVTDLLKKARRNSSHIAEMDKSVTALDERLESAFYELSDIAAEFGSYQSRLVFDPARLTLNIVLFVIWKSRFERTFRRLYV